MTKYILHGGFTGADNELNRTFFQEIGRDVPDGGTILLVYFASKTGDVREKFKNDSERIAAQAPKKTFSFLFADQEKFLDQLQQADAVYIRGGSTDKLLTTLRSYPDLKPLIKGRTVAGSSAGAYAIAKLGTAHDKKGLNEGLDLLPIRVVCHHQSPERPPYPGAVELLEATAADLELVKLRDYEWKAFNT